jgi:SNF2 family DNA or RNA helicase
MYVVHVWMLDMQMRNCVDVWQVESEPGYLREGSMQPHQLQGLQWLREAWVAHRNCVLADGMGLAKKTTVISYLQSLL